MPSRPFDAKPPLGSNLPMRPKLSLCIPTWNRVHFLKDALQSGLRELATLPMGTVDILVCNNASDDGTAELIAQYREEHPELRVITNTENVGFEQNYLNCIEYARGEFVWVMGDDDVWLPGSIAKVLHEIDSGADACLCLAETCDLQLNPLTVLRWFSDLNPPKIWQLSSPADLVRYFDACLFNAGAFAFISTAIFRRDRFLQNWDPLKRVLSVGYPHVLGMMQYFRNPLTLHYLPEVLIQNRISDLHQNSYATNNLYGRWMQDLHGWSEIADAVFGYDKAVHEAFSHIVRRNHGGDAFLPGFRVCAPTHDDWLQARHFLVRAGFKPTMIAAVDYGFLHRNSDRLPLPTQNPATHGFAVLPFLVQEAKHIAILAQGGLSNIVEGAGLLSTLVECGYKDRIRIYCAPDCTELLDGFDVQHLDSSRYFKDEGYRATLLKSFAEFAPELAINLDRERSIEADEILASAYPVGAIAYDLPENDHDSALIKALNGGYTCLIPQPEKPEAFLEALGLETTTPRLWPTSTAKEEATALLGRLGWNPEQVLVVLLDHPSLLEDPILNTAMLAAVAEGFHLIGIGGKDVSYQRVEALLQSMRAPYANLTGVLSLGSIVAFLRLCRGFVGGTSSIQALTKSCGATPFTAR